MTHDDIHEALLGLHFQPLYSQALQLMQLTTSFAHIVYNLYTFLADFIHDTCNKTINSLSVSAWIFLWLYAYGNWNLLSILGPIVNNSNRFWSQIQWHASIATFYCATDVKGAVIDFYAATQWKCFTLHDRIGFHCIVVLISSHHHEQRHHRFFWSCCFAVLPSTGVTIKIKNTAFEVSI